MLRHVAAVLGTVCVVIGAQMQSAQAAVATDAGVRRTFVARETARLQAHFDSVDAELRAVDTWTRRASQRVARAQLIAWLREYRNAARFPENDRFATPTPFFVDHRGVRCAMGELLHRSGRDDIVRDVQRTRNNARIAQLVDDPRLVAWMDSVGMTAAEAARVQPSYDGIGGGNVIDDVVVPSPTAYRTVAATLSLASLGAVGLNIARPSGVSKWAGLAVGTAAVITGAMERSNASSTTERYAAASMALGASSFAVAAYRVFAPVSTSTLRVGASRVALLPALVPAADGRSHAGVSVQATFR